MIKIRACFFPAILSHLHETCQRFVWIVTVWNPGDGLWKWERLLFPAHLRRLLERWCFSTLSSFVVRGSWNSENFKKFMEIAFPVGLGLELSQKATSNVFSYLKSTLKMSSGIFWRHFQVVNLGWKLSKILWKINLCWSVLHQQMT